MPIPPLRQLSEGEGEVEASLQLAWVPSASEVIERGCRVRLLMKKARTKVETPRGSQKGFLAEAD